MVSAERAWGEVMAGLLRLNRIVEVLLGAGTIAILIGLYYRYAYSFLGKQWTAIIVLSLANLLLLAMVRVVRVFHERTTANYESELEAHRKQLHDITLDLQTEIQAEKARTTEWKDRAQAPDWLRDIADEEAKALDRFVLIVWAGIGKSELYERRDPYLEFQLRVENRSLYDPVLEDPIGSVSFEDRELSGERIWTERTLPTHGKEGVITLRQRLDRDDVVYIMSGSTESSFDFTRLEVRAKPLRSSTKAERLLLQHRPTNAALIEKYPKLNFELLVATITPYYDFEHLSELIEDSSLKGVFVNTKIRFTNPRLNAIKISAFKLNTAPDIQRVTLATQGDLYLKSNLMKGQRQLRGPLTPNLQDSVPLIAERGVPFEGWLQFYLPGVRREVLLGKKPSVIALDDSGEGHPLETTPLIWDDIQN